MVEPIYSGWQVLELYGGHKNFPQKILQGKDLHSLPVGSGVTTMHITVKCLCFRTSCLVKHSTASHRLTNHDISHEDKVASDEQELTGNGQSVNYVCEATLK